MSFDHIGYFQFENLMQARVPLKLLLLEELPLKSWYNSLIQMHIDAVSVVVSADKAVNEIKSNNLPPHFAIVILDRDGRESARIAEELTSLGYLNAYYIEGGWDNLVREKELHRP